MIDFAHTSGVNWLKYMNGGLITQTPIGLSFILGYGDIVQVRTKRKNGSVYKNS